MNDLLDAVRKNDLKKIDQLIKQGGNVNILDRYGGTPLHQACYYGYTEIVKILLEDGALVDIPNNSGSMPLDWACYYGDTEIVKLLLENGAKVNTRNRLGDTPLHLACREDHTEILKLLLAIGSSPINCCKVTITEEEKLSILLTSLPLYLRVYGDTLTMRISYIETMLNFRLNIE